MREKTFLSHKKIVQIVVFVILCCIYILPSAAISPNNIYALPKLIFTCLILIMYILTLKKITIHESLFGIFIIGTTIYTRNLNYLVFFTIVFLEKMIVYKDYIKEYLSKSSILYICLIFTIFYSILYFGYNGRYAFTGMKEINQSGLAIFCLGILLLNKNRKVGVFTLLLGTLTLSRSYIVALFCFYFYKKLKLCNIFKTNTIKKRFNYLNLTIISSIGLILLGIFYIVQYQNGNINTNSTGINRIFNLLDMSNYFRFLAIIMLILFFKKNTSKLFFGITDEEFFTFAGRQTVELGIPYRNTVPHNLFFSHLKIYGIISVFETIYISFIIKKITNNNNFGIFVGLALYSILLGAGLYSYWLYLSAFVLISSMGEEKVNDEESKYYNS